MKTLPGGKYIFVLLSVRFDFSITAKRQLVTSGGVIRHANKEPCGSTGARLVSISRQKVHPVASLVCVK